MKKSKRGFLVLLTILVASLIGCNAKQDPVVATVEGEKITESLYRVYLWDTQQFFESISGDSIWDMELEGRKTEEIAKESALKSAIRAVLTEKKAKELGVSLTKEEEQKAKTRANDFMEENKGVGETYGFDQKNIEKLLTSTLLTEKVQNKISENYMPSEAEIEKYIQDYRSSYEQVKVNYILFHIRDENNQSLPEEVIQDKYALANEILARALDGESVNELAKVYSEDVNAQNGGEALIRRGETAQMFEEAAFNTPDGQVYEEVIETAYGYHIIETIQHILADEQEMRDEYIKQEKSAFANSELEELFKKAIIEKMSLYDEITIIRSFGEETIGGQ